MLHVRCILWLSGAFAKFGCRSPFIKPNKDDVTIIKDKNLSTAEVKSEAAPPVTEKV